MTAMTERTEMRLEDRHQIQDLALAYARGVDRRDWALVRSVYHPDAHDDHGAYKGGVDGFIDWLERRHAFIAHSMHFVTNCLIEFAGPDSALVETYYLAQQTMGPEAGESRLMLLGDRKVAPDAAVAMEVAGRYVDHFERRGGKWAIARRIVVFEKVRATEDASLTIAEDWVGQRRDGDDTLNRMRRQLGLAG